MRRLSIALIGLLAAASGLAQTPSDAEMQQYMKQAEAMGRCFSQIDQQALEDMASRGAEMDKQWRALCQSGKREEAQRSALDFVREMTRSPEVVAMRKCSEMAGGMIDSESLMPYKEEDFEDGSLHVCDHR